MYIWHKKSKINPQTCSQNYIFLFFHKNSLSCLPPTEIDPGSNTTPKMAKMAILCDRMLYHPQRLNTTHTGKHKTTKPRDLEISMYVKKLINCVLKWKVVFSLFFCTTQSVNRLMAKFHGSWMRGWHHWLDTEL